MPQKVSKVLVVESPIESVRKNLIEKTKLIDKKRFWIAVVVVILILAAISSYYFYDKYQKAQALLQNPVASTSIEAKALVDKVGKLIELPTNEQPTIATVSDVTKLADQPFFAHAQNGDKVLIYTQAKKAILYRDSINKIIEVAPVNLGQNPQPSISQTSPTPTPHPTPTPAPKTVRVAIYNGTSVSGLASSTQKKIETASPNFVVVAKADAVGTYTETIVIDLAGNQKQLIPDLIKIVGGEAGSLPSGEKKPSADILIILGTNSTSQ